MGRLWQDDIREGSLTALMKTAAEVLAEICWDQHSCDFTRQ